MSHKPKQRVSFQKTAPIRERVWYLHVVSHSWDGGYAVLEWNSSETESTKEAHCTVLQYRRKKVALMVWQSEKYLVNQ